MGEGCWHCHSQFVRPVSNEERRWGPVSKTEEYQNELQRPVMFGTRRVGPDLSREGGRHSNDWHAVHFFQPTLLSEGSPMPEYPWLFNGSPDKPNARRARSDHLRPVAGIVARKLPLLRRLPAVGCLGP